MALLYAAPPLGGAGLGCGGEPVGRGSPSAPGAGGLLAGKTRPRRGRKGKREGTREEEDERGNGREREDESDNFIGTAYVHAYEDKLTETSSQ